MIRTDKLFTFKLNMDEGDNRLTAQQLEDVIFNCLDFSILYHRQPHFFLTGTDTVYYPELWTVLDIFRGERVTFSILSDPEQKAFDGSGRTGNEENMLEMKGSGEVRYRDKVLGNVLHDRLADMLILK